MGLISQSITFTQGYIPSPTEWTDQFSAVYNLVNGQIDSANVDKTSTDGIMVLDTAQTRTGTLTHNADIIIGNTYGLIIGDATQVASGGVTAEMQVVGTAGADSTLMVGRWSADASGPAIHLLKSRHATIGSFTVVADNDVLGEIVWTPADSTDAASAGAKIFARINGTPGANDFPTELVFATTADAGNSVTERLSILADGTLAPITNDGVALGNTTLGFADLHLATGGVINWANGEITVTETDANTLTIAGVATRFDFAAGILEMNNAVEWDTGVAVVATEYSVGRDADATNQLHFNVPTGATFEWSVNDVNVAALTGGPILFINETSDTGVTTGLSINQGSADNMIVSLKSSDVAHGITTDFETDTYGALQKWSALTGGLYVLGISSSTTGMGLVPIVTTETTTKLVSSVGALQIQAGTKTGTTYAAPGADSNLVTFGKIGANGTKFIFDADGSAHADIEWVAFDTHDDLQLVADIEAMMVPEIFGEAVRYKEDDLVRMKLFGEGSIRTEENGRKRGMMNQTRMIMLHHGTLHKIYDVLTEQRNRIERLESRLLREKN